MHSSTSNSDRRYLVAALVTFVTLVGTWELVLRSHAGATVEFALERPKLETRADRGNTWVVLGNCLVMTGISPTLLASELPPDPDRNIINIAAHEQSPIAFFNYLRRSGVYPKVVIANVSSWINGTNFEQETELVAKADPLSVLQMPQAHGAQGQQAYRSSGEVTGEKQQAIESAIAQFLGTHMQTIGHRYHLFDYLMFVSTLGRTRDLDTALYQLNIQSWFRVTSSETDGRGFLGVRVDYRDDWQQGLDEMAERYLKRMRFSRLLTERYWTSLEEQVRHFTAHGTRVLLVRMPEHPAIRAFNDDTYQLPQRLKALESATKAPVLDLSSLGPAEGVRLFDSVHPDLDAAAVIAKKLAPWLRAQHLATSGESPDAGTSEIAWLRLRSRVQNLPLD